MKVAAVKRVDEPMGIVISGTTQPVQQTVFLAYEWSPAPTSSENEPKAA